MISNYFEYDPTSPSKLRWKRVSYKSRMRIGDVVGCIQSSGYWITSLNGVTMYVHRVVWELHNGKIPEGFIIDHIDRNRANNLIENLRLAEDRQNNTNKTIDKRNKTGVRGVKFRQYTNGCYYICSWIDIDGVQRSKNFSVNKYGNDIAFNMACNFRIKIIENLNNEGLCYNN